MEKRKKVKDYYTTGEYNNCIERIISARGKQNFRHEYLSASLVLSNFSAGEGEILVPITEGYDQNLQYAHLEQLADTLNSFTPR